MIERIVVAGGGTGGHLFPGIAVVEELRRRNPELEVLFVGTPRGIEARVLPRMDERVELLEVRPLKGRSPGELVRGLGLLPAAITRATRILRRDKPDLVIGVGGYAAGPVLAAAATLGIPTALLEQNAHVGMTNRMLAPVVGRAYVTFPETAKGFGRARVRVVGNPVRRAFVDASRRAMSDPDGFEARCRDVLVMGGSQGAKTLNENVPEALARTGVTDHGLRVVHQTGGAMREEVQARYRELGVDAEVVSFIDDMARAYASAAVVVARAGATTVAELCAIGRPSILVPYPYAADDHQRKNAESLERDGAAVCIPNDEASAERVAGALEPLLRSTDRRRAMAEAARGRGRPEAAAAIVDDLCEWLGCAEARAPDPSEPDADDDGSAADHRSDPSGTGHGSLRGRHPYVPRPGVAACGRGAYARVPRRALLAHPSLLE